MLQTLDLSNQTALITGASAGIGLATAETLANYGANVILAARSIDRLSAKAEVMQSDGLNAFAIKCDVSDYASVKNAVRFAIEQTGQLDILVNNAGVIEPQATLATSDPEQWARAVDINYKGVYFGMRAAIPAMLDQGYGTIINMSSGAANSALVGWSHYCSSKAASQKLTEVGHKELADKDITIVGLSPGTVATSMMAKIRDANINPVSNLDWESHIPPEWVGEAVAFLCGDGGKEFAGTDFSIKTPEGRRRVGLPVVNAPDA